jgi:hypothetical protein
MFALKYLENMPQKLIFYGIFIANDLNYNIFELKQVVDIN